MRRLGLLAVVAVALAGCGGDEAVDAPTDVPASDAVALEGETLDGEPLSLAEFRGTPVFVNVWASW